MTFGKKNNRRGILDFAPGTKFECPVCNNPECLAYDAKEKVWGRLSLFQHKAFLHCRVPVVECGVCGIHQIEIPWARDTNETRSREDLSDVAVIGIDETSCTKGHKYVTLVVDFDTSCVIHACGGKDSSTLSSFKEDHQTHGGTPDNICSVCCDMPPAFISGIKTEFPSASITFDKFHVMKIVDEGIDAVRREEVAMNQYLKNSRHL